MNRAVVIVDRVLISVLAALAAGAGGLGLAWAGRHLTWLPWSGVVANWPEAVSFSGLLVLPTTAWWWPYLLIVIGLSALLLGLRWLTAHAPSRRVRYLQLAGSDETGRLVVGGRAVVDAAALALNARPGIDTAVGSLQVRDGRLVARVDVAIEVDAELGDLAQTVDEVSGQLRSVCGRDDLTMSVLLRAVRSRSSRVE